MPYNLSMRTIAFSYIGLSFIAFFISKKLLQRLSRQGGMSRNSKDLDECRQQFIHNDALAGDDMRRVLRIRSKAPHVAVIGAGVAGLRCADVLIRAGVKVSIYEARDRVGGRVHQVESGGRLVDLGPNWVHGNVKSNPISRLAAKTKTTLHEWEDRQAVIDSTGHRMDDDEAETYSEIVWEIVAQAFKYSDRSSRTIDPQKSLWDYFKEEVPKRESDPAKIAEILKMATRWGAFVGDPIERQSLKFFFLEETIDGENAFVAGTYQKILAEIAAHPLAHAEVHLNTEIQRIETPKLRGQGTVNGELAGIQHKSLGELDEPKISIYTASGLKHEFDDVVVTAPLGWLKAHKETAFTPPLPQRLSEAVDNISYGRLEKCYITFPTAFWHGTSSHRHTDTDSKCSNGPDTASTSPDPYPSFTHFQSPLYVAHPPHLSWNQRCVSLSDLPASTAHPTLLFYLFGPCATAMVQSITSIPPHTTAYHEILSAFFEPFYSKLPHYDAHDKTCQPTAFLATQWQNDRFAGNGCYTNYQVGLREGDRDIEVMRHGVPERGLWLAGEHTSPFIALGTTTGAYWAGEGVARRICREYGLTMPVEDREEDGNGAVVDGKVGVEGVRPKEVGSGKRGAANLNGLAL
jgi:hypothetical protein